jgi:CheY-like chemotaxis protein
MTSPVGHTELKDIFHQEEFMEGVAPIRATALGHGEGERWLGERADSGRRGRVLVISNDRASQSVLATLATIEGCEATVSPHGADALQAIRTWRPRLIILDLDNVEDRLEVIVEYRESARANTPMVLLSGSDLGDAWLEREGVVAVLPKPFPAAELMDLLRKFAHCSG